MTEPKHGTRPIPVDESPGTRAYCTCGHSASLPYCDGSHSRLQTGCRPIVCEIQEPGRKWICQCHRSGTPPWCDGTHKTLAASGGAA